MSLDQVHSLLVQKVGIVPAPTAYAFNLKYLQTLYAGRPYVGPSRLLSADCLWSILKPVLGATIGRFRALPCNTGKYNRGLRSAQI